MVNIEIKASYPDLDNLRMLVKNAGGNYKETMIQRDTYFNAPVGKRLKLREFDNQESKLVGYFRNNTTQSKESDWEAITIQDPEKFKKVMDSIYGIFIEVIKKRELWIIKHTRVHLDEVAYLGNFMELETVIDGITLDEGRKEHNKIIKALRIKKENLQEKSYSNILIEKNIAKK